MGHEREIAGVFAGIIAVALIWQGRYEAAIALASAMMGFFIGERNGERRAKNSKKEN